LLTSSVRQLICHELLHQYLRVALAMIERVIAIDSSIQLARMNNN
jgi:hypothetical protein